MGTVEKRTPKGMIRWRVRQLPFKGKSLKLPPDLVYRNIAALRKLAAEVLKSENKDPAEYLRIVLENRENKSTELDRAYLAACVLDDLYEIERRWHNVGTDRGLGLADAGVQLASNFAHLTLSCWEKEAHAGLKILPPLRRRTQAANAAKHKQASAKWARCNMAAQPIWKRHPDWSATAVAEQLRKDLGLTDKVPTIAKKLKKPGTAS